MLVIGTLGGLALGLWLLGTVWPVDNDAETALVYGGTSGFFSGLLGGAAAAGSLSMTGPRTAWLAPVVGILFAVGFTGLVLAGMGSDSAPWLVIGAACIAACVVWFYIIGMISGVLPTLQRRQFGGWAALAAAVIILIVGVATGSMEGLVFGILSIAAWAGIAIGSVVARRARPATTAARR